jgi:RND superfamily putative drug exporter
LREVGRIGRSLEHAAAVLIDATVVRAVLLPASMRLLGEWNWYLPKFLERLPQAAPARDAA